MRRVCASCVSYDCHCTAADKAFSLPLTSRDYIHTKMETTFEHTDKSDVMSAVAGADTYGVNAAAAANLYYYPYSYPYEEKSVTDSCTVAAAAPWSGYDYSSWSHYPYTSDVTSHNIDSSSNNNMQQTQYYTDSNSQYRFSAHQQSYSNCSYDQQRLINYVSSENSTDMIPQQHQQQHLALYTSNNNQQGDPRLSPTIADTYTTTSTPVRSPNHGCDVITPTTSHHMSPLSHVLTDHLHGNNNNNNTNISQHSSYQPITSSSPPSHVHSNNNNNTQYLVKNECALSDVSSTLTTDIEQSSVNTMSMSGAQHFQLPAIVAAVDQQEQFYYEQSIAQNLTNYSHNQY